MMQAKTKLNIVDRPLPKGKSEVNLSAFSLLFSEMVQYSLSRTNQTTEIERRLSDIGWLVGVRILELLVYREKGCRRETKLIGVLGLIQNVVWKILFGKPADSIEKSVSSDDQYYIMDNQPLTNRFISVPKEFGDLNCAAFIAGIVKGVLDSTDFFPEKVTAHSVIDNQKPKTVIIIKFNQELHPSNISV